LERLPHPLAGAANRALGKVRHSGHASVAIH
jgi:hypothetical protein